MKIGSLGSGAGARPLGKKLVNLGHEVQLGTRDSTKLTPSVAALGRRAAGVRLADAARHGEVIINATAGIASVSLAQQRRDL
jgi:8-hydroxy-5-deazaflavin:NADPH oxidoreductase